jgi:protease IV
MLLAIVLGILLLWNAFGTFSDGFNLGRGKTKMGAQSGHHFQEVTVEDNSSNDKILIIEVDGIITSQGIGRGARNMVDIISDQLKVASKDEDVKAVLLKIDSPGGEVMASDDIARAIELFQQEHKKPVIASMGGLAASGGYYISAPCQWIVANELTLTGSIGVIMHSFNFRGLLDKVGVMPQVYKSGKFKDMLSSTKKPEEIDPAERKMIEDMIMETYNKFTQVVADGRANAHKKNGTQGKALVNDWKNYADGRVITGKQALELGFVDELGNFQAAVRRAQKLAKISDANLIRYEEPFDLSHMFSLFGQSQSKTLKIDVGMDFPKLEAGRPYFLAPTVIH